MVAIKTDGFKAGDFEGNLAFLREVFQSFGGRPVATGDEHTHVLAFAFDLPEGGPVAGFYEKCTVHLTPSAKAAIEAASCWDASLHTVVHELFHAIRPRRTDRVNGARLPQWLDEGLTELCARRFFQALGVALPEQGCYYNETRAVKALLKRAFKKADLTLDDVLAWKLNPTQAEAFRDLLASLALPFNATPIAKSAIRAAIAAASVPQTNADEAVAVLDAPAPKFDPYKSLLPPAAPAAALPKTVTVDGNTYSYEDAIKKISDLLDPYADVRHIIARFARLDLD